MLPDLTLHHNMSLHACLYCVLCVLPPTQEIDDNVITPEKAEEVKLKARYPHLGAKPGGSDLLRKRLQKGVCFLFLLQSDSLFNSHMYRVARVIAGYIGLPRVAQWSKDFYLSARGVSTGTLVRIQAVSQPTVIGSPIGRRTVGPASSGFDRGWPSL